MIILMIETVMRMVTVSVTMMRLMVMMMGIFIDAENPKLNQAWLDYDPQNFTN